MDTSGKPDKVEEQIIHYQKKLERYTAENRNESLQYCIHKLKYLPVTVVHLEKTGVGKSVNMLRNYDGVTGSKARALVNKWKEMVALEERDEATDQSNNHQESTDEYQHNSSANNTAPSYDNELQMSISEDYDSNGNDLTIEDKVQNSYNPYTSQADYMSAGSSSQPAYNPTDEYIPTNKNILASYENIDTIYSPTQGLHIDDNAINGYGNNDNNSSEEDSGTKHKSNDSEDGTSVHEMNNKKCDRDRKHKNNITEEDSTKKHKNKHKNKEKSKHKHKHHTKDKKKSKHSPSKASHHREDKSSNHTLVEPLKKDAGSKNNDRSHSNNKDRCRKSDAKRSKRPLEPMTDFESALLGMDSCSPKKKKKRTPIKQKTQEPLATKASYSSASESSLAPLPSRLPTAMNDISERSFQLSTSYRPMPPIANKVYESSMQYGKEEEGLNFMFRTKNTRQKTIYTGKTGNTLSGKYGVVDSLFNQCIRVLQDNIDALEYTGGIPYMILKPVFEKATPLQLFNIENFNPYLLEDTSPLWELHCKRSFKNMKREEMETYRDMFIRCTDEKDQKLKNITQMLERKFVTKAAPKRTTQLAEFVGAPGRSFKKMAKNHLVVVQPSTPSTSTAVNSSRTSSSSSSSRPTTAIRQAAAKKPKMGAMMAKSLQLYKKIFRR